MAHYSRAVFDSIVPILITCCIVCVNGVVSTKEDNLEIERNNDSLVYVPHGPLVQCNLL